MFSKIKINPLVKEALANNIPVVALESTIISHGMPYPDNVITAKNCEKIICEQGCVPATIAIIHGEIIVGLTAEEIDYIGKTGMKVRKTSRRDLPYVVSQKQDGATTVSATMIIAQMAGIKMFATGGIGGVHRKAEITMDVSADLDELAKTNVCVVCAGIKAILDIEKTLEYLETKGVPVISYGVAELPDFYTRSSGIKANFRIDTPVAIAQFLKTKWELGLEGGVVVANPIPAEYSLDPQVMNQAIDEALRQMESQNIKGKEATPFLLKTVTDLTGGESLASNIKLVYNNCLLASLIAKELVK